MTKEELEKENARLREALRSIAKRDYGWCGDLASRALGIDKDDA